MKNEKLFFRTAPEFTTAWASLLSVYFYIAGLQGSPASPVTLQKAT
jgi:hypothetical protein